MISVTIITRGVPEPLTVTWTGMDMTPVAAADIIAAAIARGERAVKIGSVIVVPDNISVIAFNVVP